MKIAMLYTVWTGDDIDMLNESCKRHSPYVDEIHIWYQACSNRGSISLVTRPKLDAQRKDLKIKIANWEPDLNLSTKENERVKHNAMIQEAKKQGFTHFIMAACDHFYDGETLESAKKLMSVFDLDLTLTRMITYYKTKDMAIWPLEDYCMPFIHKMYPETAISKTASYPVRVDPSVKVNTYIRNLMLTPNQGILHHYSMVRPDIVRKFRNAAASINWSEAQVERFISEYENAKIGDHISYFQGRKLERTELVLEKIKNYML